MRPGGFRLDRQERTAFGAFRGHGTVTVRPVRSALPVRCVLDGELVIALGDALDFEALQLRLHPAASRVRKLAGEIPASIDAAFADLPGKLREARTTQAE